jgi:hypothetical protein
MSRSSVPTGYTSVPTGIVTAPLMPGSRNLTVGATGKIQASNLSVPSSLSLFGQSPVTKQTISPTFDSIIAFLQNVGLASQYFAQQGSKLVGTGNTGTSRQGRSVALSADGTTLAVGGWEDDTAHGAVWIFVRDTTGSWSQQGAKLVATGSIGAAHLGASVSLSADGNTLAVGGNTDNTDVGATWIFTRNGTTWSQQAKLIGTGSAAPSSQGASVSLSANGSTVAIGGPLDSGYIGATWIFTRDTAGSWSQVGAKLVGIGNSGQCQQGVSVSLSNDGTVVAIGGSQDNGYMGAVWVFGRDSVSGAWSQVGTKLVGSGHEGIDVEMGTSVAISGDGLTIAAGGPYDNTNIGAVWIFTNNAGAWTQQGSKLVGAGYVGTDIEQGQSVSLNVDGTILVVGATQDNSGIGACWTYGRDSGSNWTPIGPKIIGSGYTGSPVYEGTSIAISKDGTTFALGGLVDNSEIGATWIFTRSH